VVGSGHRTEHALESRQSTLHVDPAPHSTVALLESRAVTSQEAPAPQVSVSVRAPPMSVVHPKAVHSTTQALLGQLTLQ
jgi:hypothetical protein